MQPKQIHKPYYNIYIATPMFMNMCHALYAQSIIHLTHAFRNAGMNCHFNYIINQSTIEKNRNELCALFLSQPTATHLLFVDADISFDPDAVVRMVQAEVDIIAGSYPIKRINWDRYKQAIRDNRSGGNLNYAAFDYSYISSSDVKLRIDPGSNEMMEVEGAGTGLMLIKRHVIEKLSETAPYYISTTQNMKDMRVPYLFNAGVDENNNFTTEDVYFCRNWKKLGGKIYVARWIKIIHTGSFEYGNLDE